MFTRVFFYKLDNIITTKLGPQIRTWGQNMFRKGVELQGEFANPDVLVPSLRCVPLSNNVYPRLLEADWVAPNATVIGNVELKEGSSLWHGTVVRGDTAQINVGKNTLILD